MLFHCSNVSCGLDLKGKQLKQHSQGQSKLSLNFPKTKAHFIVLGYFALLVSQSCIDIVVELVSQLFLVHSKPQPCTMWL